MEWQTHMLSGVVAGYAVTGGDWRGAIIGGIAGVVSDLDEPKSKFGKYLFFISIPVNKIFGHRTFTHSLLFTLIAGSILFPFFGLWVSLAAMSGILAHIAGDMFTGKVNFFYPFKRSVGFGIPFSLFVPIDRVARYVLFVLFLGHLYTKHV